FPRPTLTTASLPTSSGLRCPHRISHSTKKAIFCSACVLVRSLKARGGANTGY
ncbi:hypothetical protein JMJ77_0000978, partial [Colletotrichum scovillei]